MDVKERMKRNMKLRMAVEPKVEPKIEEQKGVIQDVMQEGKKAEVEEVLVCMRCGNKIRKPVKIAKDDTERCNECLAPTEWSKNKNK